jgi:hypothetical protein
MATARRRTRGYIEDRPERAKGRFRAVVYAGVDPLTGKSRYRASPPTPMAWRRSS